jgi:hypothetical protein
MYFPFLLADARCINYCLEEPELHRFRLISIDEKGWRVVIRGNQKIYASSSYYSFVLQPAHLCSLERVRLQFSQPPL